MTSREEPMEALEMKLVCLYRGSFAAGHGNNRFTEVYIDEADAQAALASAVKQHNLGVDPRDPDHPGNYTARAVQVERVFAATSDQGKTFYDVKWGKLMAVVRPGLKLVT
jgi:hypothetical protein